MTCADHCTVYSPQFGTMAQGISFATRLIKAFLTGFGLATGVSLFFMPVNARKPVFGEFVGALHGMQSLMKSLVTYMQAFEQDNLFADDKSGAEGDVSMERRRFMRKKKSMQSPRNGPVHAESAALKGAVGALVAVLGKLYGDIPFAKREIAYGKLGASDLSTLHKMLRHTALPLVGLSSIVNIFERLSKELEWDKMANDPTFEDNNRSRRSFKDWQQIMGTLHEPFAQITECMGEAIQHILYQLELQQRPKKASKDVEFEAESSMPGTMKFTDRFSHKIDTFYDSKQVTLHQWCEQRGIHLPPGSFDTSFNWSQIYDHAEDGMKERHQRQLFAVLYMEYLLHAAAKALLDLVHYADAKVEEGAMKKAHFIVPGVKTFKKWARSVFSSDEDTSNDDHRVMAEAGSPYEVNLGQAFNGRKDPEHLPPENLLERMGNGLRLIPRGLRSRHSVFGFRAACAIMTVGILAYLRATYLFFIQQRLVWSMIMIAFSMARTSGQSAFNFIMRILGSIVAMTASYVIWYIVDGKTPGVIVFLFIWITACFYVVIKKPRWVIVGILSAVTSILIIGYELQVKRIGQQAAAANGQPYYPTYELAPYRVACVSGGLFVAYIWTIFPYPITEQNELRRNVGSALYLAANFYSVVHETTAARTRGESQMLDKKDNPLRRLEKIGTDLFSKSHLLIAALRASSDFSKFQISIGGRFPKEVYDAMTGDLERIVRCTALVSYASRTFTQGQDGDDADPETEWQRDFKKIITSVDATSHDITSRLALLSSSVSNAQPLPPYLQPLEPFRLLHRLEGLDRDILSVRHLAEPGYAAFAVIQIACRMIVADINNLTVQVKLLVGELDFSFHVVSTADSGATSSSSLGKGEKVD